MNLHRLLQFLKKKFYPLEQTIFYLLILFLPTQLGKHFWPNFSYIQGIRIDYLSPTLYLTDILIILLAVLSLFNKFSYFRRLNFKFQISNFKFQKVRKLLDIGKLKFLILVLFLLVGVILSKSPPAGFYGLIKIFEFAFFGYYVSRKIRSIKDLKLISLIFTIGILLESLLGVAQYISQSSIGNIFYFLGERTFNSQTPGIANASLNGELVLRPYGTFSHPNVLAAYLTIALTIAISNFKFQISNFKKIILGASIFIGSAALLLTMSRVAIILWLFIASFFVLRYFLFIFFTVIPARRPPRRASPLGGKAGIQKRGSPIRSGMTKGKLWMTRVHDISFLFIVLIIGIILVLSPIRYRFTNFNLNDESLIARKDLINTSFEMVKDNPIFGVGINNFLVNIPYYQKFNASSLFTYFQPVHNIFLLVAAETGIIGLLFFLWFISKTFKRIKNQKSGIKKKSVIHYSKFIVLSIVIILGLFDHYFLTLQQGQLIFSFVLGLCWARYKT